MSRFTVFFALLLGCPIAHPPTEPPEPEPDPIVVPEIGDEAAVRIDDGGGEVRLGELVLEVPPGALAAPTEIRVVAESAAIPDGFTSYSPIYHFEPAGLRFEIPVRVSLPFSGDGELATIFWTREGSEQFLALDTTTEGGRAFADVQHFSEAFVGTACADGDCCRRARSSLDVLLMVDNSNSMAEEQAALQEQLPRFVQALATGDVDLDGVQDFPAVGSLQLGTVSSDMGSGGFSVPTCDESAFGDDAVLRSEGNTTLPGCDATYPPFQSFADGSDPTAFAAEVSCVAAMGISGCGFEQQLEAMLKALTPSTAATSFAMGTTGHGDGANAGLVRDDAVLALVSLTDEDDCSALDPELFDAASARYSGDLNLRCFQFPEAVHPVDRYVEGLLSLKEDARDLVYATISGVPPTLDGASYEDIFADPAMIEQIDPAMPTRLTPSCNRPGGGLAFPPRRMVEVARQLEAQGATGVVGSICQDDFEGPVSRILEQVARSVSGRCE